MSAAAPRLPSSNSPSPTASSPPPANFPVVPPASRAAHDFIGDVAFSPDGRLLYAADLYHDSIAGRQSAIRHGDPAHQDRPPPLPHSLPSRWQNLLRHRTGPMARVGHYDAAAAACRTRHCASARIPPIWCGATARRNRPQATRRLYRAHLRRRRQYQQRLCHRRHRRQGTQRRREHQLSHDAAPAARHDALRAGPQRRWKRLFVACSDANAAAVVDVSGERSRVEGFIPTGWYPTAVRALPSGRLVVLNGKGVRSYPNPERPQPLASAPTRCTKASRAERSTSAACRPARRRGSTPSRGEQLDRLDATKRSPTRPTAMPSSTNRARCRPDPARHLHRQGKPHLRSGAGRHERGQRRRHRSCSSAKTPRPTFTRSRASSFCSTISTSMPMSAPTGITGPPPPSRPITCRRCGPTNTPAAASTYDFEEQDAASLPPAGYLWTNANAAGLSHPQLRLHGE